MAQKATLAMTLRDHYVRGRTPPSILIDNSGLTLAETMSRAQILAYMEEDLQRVREAQQAEQDFLCGWLCKEVLMPNVHYLKAIGQFPAELRGVDFKREFIQRRCSSRG